ncbi:MAG: S-adenosyl-l-methionine hydroxide adenosyltransferase family protein [Candidatus Binatia bacterium]
METKFITLTTDFGHRDPFVGTMKGVILGVNPHVRIVDLTHGIPPQDLIAGALALRASVSFFPRGTIHVAVVDPGVGSERRPLVIESEQFLFVGPDNGIFSLALQGQAIKQAIELSNETYHLKPTSKTFHGRDIFAPVAAHLAQGVPPREMGRPAKELSKLPYPEVIKTEGVIQGVVMYVDGFGNLVTNIDEHDLKTIPPEDVVVSVGDLTIQGLAPTYSHAEQGGYIALINSSGLLEVSLFKGNAQACCGAKIGAQVRIRDHRLVP